VRRREVTPSKSLKRHAIAKRLDPSLDPCLSALAHQP
jgi:hypothetical protein